MASDDGDFTFLAPSNASLKLFPNNTQSRFTIKTAQPINLDKYEVALTDIQYPRTWKNVPDCEITLRMTSLNEVLRLKIEGGHYQNIQTLMQLIDSMLDGTKKLLEARDQPSIGINLRDALRIELNAIRMRVVLSVRVTDLVIHLPQPLADILGFDKTELGQGVHVSRYRPDIDRGMTALFLYTNFVQNRLVGDALVPLLHVIPITNGINGTSVHKEFLHPCYVGTINTVTDILEFDLRRDDGTTVSFESGKVIASLHFRRVAP
jgi:hypothetical protein